MHPGEETQEASRHEAGRPRTVSDETLAASRSEDCKDVKTMRKEFESELAKRVSGKKAPSKAWAMVALCATILVCGAVAVTAASAGDMLKLQDQDQIQDQLKDGSCVDSDGDGICDNFVDEDGDGICDLCGTCTCVDCPCIA